MGQDEKSAFTMSMSKVMSLQATVLTGNEQGRGDSKLLTSFTERDCFYIEDFISHDHSSFMMGNLTN